MIFDDMRRFGTVEPVFGNLRANKRLDRFTLRSKSKNTPFDRQRLEGRVLGTWVGGHRVHEG